MLTVVILTRDEEKHIARAIGSVANIADRIVVVDSGSTDGTVQIAQGLGAQILSNPWRNHATQFNWALAQLPDDSVWILRLDADEIVTAALATEIKARLSALDPMIVGVRMSRRMTFLRRPIRWGGLFPIRILRLFKHKHGRCEDRWMDEHIIVDGETAEFAGEIVDDNMNPLSWWTAKHNAYASREVVDLLNLEYGFMPSETVADLRRGGQAGFKRWLKEKCYARLPIGLRALLYFVYRYLIRLGFLDGREGAAFHVLQGFWYRYLVDMKLHEVRLAMAGGEQDVVAVIKDMLGIDVRAQTRATS